MAIITILLFIAIWLAIKRTKLLIGLLSLGIELWQLESKFKSWLIKAGPLVSFKVVDCSHSNPAPMLCPSPGRIYVYMKNSGKLPAYRATLENVLVPAKPELTDTGPYIPLDRSRWNNDIHTTVTDVYPGKKVIIMNIDSQSLNNYLDKIFEVCYSTPILPHLRECVRMTLKQTGTSVEVVTVDRGTFVSKLPPLFRGLIMYIEFLELAFIENLQICTKE